MKKLFLLFVIFGFFSISSFAEPTTPSVKREKRIGQNTKIDYDFTKMNYNMATGIVFDMMIAPEDYKNKTAKIKGQFLTDVYQGTRAFAVVIWDAGGCCPTGVTVVPLEGRKYPEDFPAEKGQVTVTGVLELLKIYGGDAICLVAEKWEY